MPASPTRHRPSPRLCFSRLPNPARFLDFAGSSHASLLRPLHLLLFQSKITGLRQVAVEPLSWTQERPNRTCPAGNVPSCNILKDSSYINPSSPPLNTDCFIYLFLRVIPERSTRLAHDALPPSSDVCGGNRAFRTRPCTGSILALTLWCKWWLSNLNLTAIFPCKYTLLICCLFRSPAMIASLPVALDATLVTRPAFARMTTLALACGTARKQLAEPRKLLR